MASSFLSSATWPKILVETSSRFSALSPIGGDPHMYEATPEDARLVARADIILINGLTFEGWINEVIGQFRDKRQDGAHHGRHLSHYLLTTQKCLRSPHAWMDAENGLIYIRNIKDALVAADPKKWPIFMKKITDFTKPSSKTCMCISKEKNCPHFRHNKEYLSLLTMAFSYFGKKYGIKGQCHDGRFDGIPRLKHQTMKRVVKSIVDEKVPAIFVESTINPKLLQQNCPRPRHSHRWQPLC